MYPITNVRMIFLFIGIVSLTLWTLGCSSTGRKERVDTEVYGIIEEKSAETPGAESGFSIDAPDSPVLLENLPHNEHANTELGYAVKEPAGAAIISLENAILLAVQRNRNYQTAKETLFLQALSLIIDRHRYTPIFTGSGQITLNRTASDISEPSLFPGTMAGVRSIFSELEQLTGSQTDLVSAYANLIEEAGNLAGLDEPSTRLVEERRITGKSSIGVEKLLLGGGRIALTLTSNLLRFLTGEPREASASALQFAFTQPLIRGFGKEIAAEKLTQAERDMLYALRDFTHYRKQFTVNVCSAYYGVLQQRDVVKNTWVGLQNFMKNVERERAFAQEGLRTQADLGRMVQFQLDNENRYINAARRYQEELDEFKILLGLSTETAILLDPQELERLRDQGLNHPEVNVEDAVKVAMAARLDLYNERDRVADAKRRVTIAANALKPGIDLKVDALVNTSGDNAPLQFDFNRMEWNIGLDVDPLLDKKTELKAWRSSLIDLERAVRRSTLAEDTIKLEVRAAWRNLEQAKRNYEVAVESVKLNQRRVEEQQLLSELGLATAQDQVDAQNDLIQAQNNLTSALVTHTLARLNFWRDMGILYIGKTGVFKEVFPDKSEVTSMDDDGVLEEREASSINDTR